jgi:hypothetical protein
MSQVVHVLFGAAFTVATAWALGSILLRRLSLTLYRLEDRLFAFILGSACLSAIVFALAVVKLARESVFLFVGIGAIGYALYSGAHRPAGKDFAPLTPIWRWTFIAVFGFFTALYFPNAMAPEMSPDGIAYHLAFVAQYFQAHGFVPIRTNIYAQLSEGMEMLYLFAFAFGKHSAAALVHYSFLVALSFLMLCFGRRIGYPAVGVAGALFFYASPVVGLDGTIAYNDVAVALTAFALFYLLQIWDGEKNPKVLVPVGILAGFSYAIKYTAFLAVPYAIGFVLWKLWRARKPMLRPVLVTAGLALVFILPWMVKNSLWVANPVSPFGNRVFPNRYVHVSFEDDYRRFQRVYGLKSYSQIPMQLTLKGDVLAGFFGPLFLLTPVALLALRFSAGRQLLLAAVVFGIPYFANVGARFLIPAAPFISLALALAFANFGWLLLPLVVAHAISCWPPVASRYCASAAWRLNKIPLKAALRIETEDSYLSRRSRQYNEARMIEQLVPEGQRVFSFHDTGAAYTSREILMRYQGALNETIDDILWTPLFNSYQPTRGLTFHFPQQHVRKIRVIRTAAAETVSWSIAEFRLFDAGAELPRTSDWRLTAHPNPWDVQLAFDNDPVTRWKSWQAAEAGMFVEVDFGRAQAVDSVAVETTDEDFQNKIKLDGMDSSGRWTTLSAQPEESAIKIRASLRHAATAEVQALGVHFVLTGKDEPEWDDFEKHAELWGIKRVGEVTGARLYHIE